MYHQLSNKDVERAVQSHFPSAFIIKSEASKILVQPITNSGGPTQAEVETFVAELKKIFEYQGIGERVNVRPTERVFPEEMHSADFENRSMAALITF